MLLRVNTFEFSSLVMGFHSSTLSYLQEGKNIELAKQNINILSMLKAKTKGNLSSGETELLDRLLADLQTKFAEMTKLEL